MDKRDFLECLANELTEAGFRKVLLVTRGTVAHYCRQAPDELWLNLGIEVSSVWNERFTGSFYLGPSFTWGLVFPGFPNEAYSRIGSLLTIKERKLFVDADFNKTTDVWWDGYSPNNIHRFVNAVTLTASRLVSKAGISDAVLKCPGVQRHKLILNAVKSEVLQNDSSSDERLMSEKVDEIFTQSASKALLKLAPELHNQAVINRFAKDCWRLINIGRRL
jgi:hypothetical protein